jgi:hypothetical protein
MDNLDPRYLKARELYENLLALSPDNGDVAARLPLYTGDGTFVGEVLLSGKDLDALTGVVNRLGVIAEMTRMQAADTAQTPDPLLTEADRVLLDLDDLTDWDTTTPDVPVPFVPGPRRCSPSEATLWATLHPELAADVADALDGLAFPDDTPDAHGGA